MSAHAECRGTKCDDCYHEGYLAGLQAALPSDPLTVVSDHSDDSKDATPSGHGEGDDV